MFSDFNTNFNNAELLILQSFVISRLRPLTMRPNLSLKLLKIWSLVLWGEGAHGPCDPVYLPLISLLICSTSCRQTSERGRLHCYHPQTYQMPVF